MLRRMRPRRLAGNPLMSDTHILKVLMVEDNPSDVQIFKQMLGRLALKHSVMDFPKGEDALAWLDQHPEELPQLIILDLELPGGMHGIEVLKKIKSQPSLEPIPVIVNTTSNNHDDLSKTYRYGATFFMQKLYDIKTLGEVITHLKVTGRLKDL